MEDNEIRKREYDLIDIIEPKIEFRKVKKCNLEGGVIFDGFQSYGLTGTIACGCFINSIKTDLIGVLDSPSLPSLSIIYNSTANFPIRIYGSEEQKLAFFTSELAFEPRFHKPIAKNMIHWAKWNKCKTIISIIGNTTQQALTSNSLQTGLLPTKVYGAVNSRRGLVQLKGTGVIPIVEGSIRGIPGILLNEGMLAKIDVIVFVVDVISNIPNFRAAAKVSEIISKIVPNMYCDTNSLLKEADVIEKNTIANNISTLTNRAEQIYQ